MAIIMKIVAEIIDIGEDKKNQSKFVNYKSRLVFSVILLP